MNLSEIKFLPITLIIIFLILSCKKDTEPVFPVNYAEFSVKGNSNGTYIDQKFVFTNINHEFEMYPDTLVYYNLDFTESSRIPYFRLGGQFISDDGISTFMISFVLTEDMVLSYTNFYSEVFYKASGNKVISLIITDMHPIIFGFENVHLPSQEMMVNKFHINENDQTVSLDIELEKENEEMDYTLKGFMQFKYNISLN